MATAETTIPGILPHHLRELRTSGLRDDTIQAAGIHSETKHEHLAAILDWPRFPQRMAPAIVYPFPTADGVNGYYRIKPDNPRINVGTNKPIKYESPKGRGNQIYLPPGVAKVLDDPTVELILTEGEKKSLASTQEGFPAIGLVGVYGWKDKHGESLLPSLERIAWKGRQVRVVFDSDIQEKPDVHQAETRLAAQLKNRGAVVRVVRLPSGPNGEKQGLDDFLVSSGIGPFRQLLEAAEDPEAVPAIQAKLTAKLADPATEAAVYIETEVVDEVPTRRFWRGSFYQWRNGRYIELPMSEARGQLIRFLNRRLSFVTSKVTSDIFDQLKGQSVLASTYEPPCWLSDNQDDDWHADHMLIAQNGIVNLQTLDIRKPTPQLFSPTALDFDFDINAPKPTNWLRFLDELWGDDRESIEAFQDWFGYCLTLDTRPQAVRSGKWPKCSRCRSVRI